MGHLHHIRRRQLLLGLAALLPSLGRAAQAVPVFVGDGIHGGSTARLLDWLAAEAALSWSVRPTPWLRAQRLVAAGEGVMFGLGRTPSRESSLAFSVPVWMNHTWAVVRDGEQARVRRYSDLAGQTVCWARGSSYGELFADGGLGRMTMREANDDDTAMRMVAALRCQAALLTLETDQPELALRHPALTQLKERGLALVPTPMATAPVHFACGKGSRWAWVIDRIDPVLARSRPLLDRMRQI